MLRRFLDPGDWLGMKPALDPKASPLALTYAPAQGEVKLRIGVGLAVLCIAALAAWLLQADSFAVLVACGFGFFALLNLLYGVLQSGFEKSLLVTDAMIFVKTRNLFVGRREWREPLANYRGVLLREEHLRRQSVGNVESTRTCHVVELAHDDPRRSVPLHVREDGPPPRDVQEAFARRLKLPALAPDAGGEASRPAAALDAPLARTAPARDPGPPPSGVVLTQQGDETRIVVGVGRRGRAFAWLFWLLLPLAFGVVVYQLDPPMGLAAGGMAALFVLLILGLGRLVGGGEKDRSAALVIDPVAIRIEHPKLWRPAILRAFPGGPAEPAPQSLRRDAVEQVRVDAYASHRDRDGAPSFHARLVIEGDEGRLALVEGQFDGGKLEWIRDYLLGVVLPATAPSSPSASAGRPAAAPPR